MFCFHKYGEIKDGFQYCLKCGKAIFVKIECQHKWKTIRIGNVKHGGLVYAVNYVQECEKCGCIINKQINTTATIY